MDDESQLNEAPGMAVDGLYRLRNNVRDLLFDDFVVLARLDRDAPGWIKIGCEAHKWLCRCTETKPSQVAALLPESERVGFFRLLDHLLRKGYLEDDLASDARYRTSVIPDPCGAQETDGIRGKKSAYYSVSDGCNLACQHCYVRPRIERERRAGNLADSRTVLERLADYGVSTVILTGGEPLLRQDIAEIARYAKSLIGYVAMTTNGILIDRDLAVELKQSGIDAVSLSIEGTSPEVHDRLRGRGTFEQVCRAVVSLKEAGFAPSAINLCGTVTRSNYQDLLRLNSFACDLGVTHSFSLFQPAGRGRSNMDQLLLSGHEFVEFTRCLGQESAQSLAAPASAGPDASGELNQPATAQSQSQPVRLRLKTGCGMGRSMVAVRENGDVVPCHLFLGSDDMLMGNVLREEDLLSIVKRNLDKWVSVDEVASCKSCNVRYFCGGCCPGGTYWGKGTFHAPSPYCNAFKSMYAAMLSGAGASKQDEVISSKLDCPR